MDVFTKNILNLNQQLSLSNIRFSNTEKIRGSKPDSVFIIGMGGSGIVGTILQNITKDVNIKIPIIPWNDYGLPPEILAQGGCFKNPLLIFVSFSGNTQETLSGFKKSKNYKLRAAVAGGGKLLAMAKKNKVAFASFEKNQLAPRQANGLMVYAALGIIKKALPQTRIPDLSKKIRPGGHQLIGKNIAGKIKSGAAMIYTTAANRHLGYIWKIHLNETGKHLAFNNVIPEMNHNEIVGFETKPKNITAILLTANNDSSIHQKRFQITKKVWDKFQISSIHIFVNGQNGLERTFNAIASAQWCAYFLAKGKKLNPLQTKTIDLIKSLL